MNAFRMSRIQWILSALVALLLLLLAAFLLLTNANDSMADGKTPEVGKFVTAPTQLPPLTARGGYERALPLAKAWAEDAQLWRAEAAWSPGSDLQAPATAWTYTFYSSSREAQALIVTTGDSENLLRTRRVANAPDLIDVEPWQFDSPSLFEVIYANGGEAFLTVNPQHSMLLILRATAPLRWEVTLTNEGPIGNAAGRQMFSLTINATDGRLITAPVNGDSNE